MRCGEFITVSCRDELRDLVWFARLIIKRGCIVFCLANQRVHMNLTVPGFPEES